MDKTRDRILQHCNWPGLFGGVRDYCRTCPECRKTCRIMTGDKVKLVRVPIIKKPFTV
jgi:hypothetical protein